MGKERKRFTAEEKVRALRRHLVEKTPISGLCEELGIQPTQFYRWQQQFFENGTSAFEQKPKSNGSAEKERIAALEQKIRRKDEVLAELMEEHVALKKSLGEI
jgi:transposase-like protein